MSDITPLRSSLDKAMEETENCNSPSGSQSKKRPSSISSFSSLPPARKAAEDKDIFVIEYKDPNTNNRYLVKVSEVWIDVIEQTFYYPPPKLQKKCTLIRRTPPDEKSWLQYKIIKSYGPYDYKGATQKEKALSDRETSESDERLSCNVGSKRKVTNRKKKLPGEPSSSESEQRDSSEDEKENPAKKSKKLSTHVDAIVSVKEVPGRSKDDSGFTDADDDEIIEEGFEGEHNDEPPQAKTLIKAVDPKQAKKRSRDNHGQVLVDARRLDVIEASQHTVIKELRALRCENRQRRVDADDEENDDGILPAFPLKTLLSALQLNKSLRDKTQGPLVRSLLVKKMKRQAGDKVPETVMNVFDFLYEENLQEKFSWSGLINKEKRKFDGTETCKAMIQAVMEISGTKKEVENSIKSKLQHAEERNTNRQKARAEEERLTRLMEEALETEAAEE
ncbi:hypothetical protein QAD02_022956 [Eretmocerus hayati]|uniref:Uncharacterized protein n=1 Tax=Eretmocerus hayati TaxID=131215 RepID=A0ACC2PXT9_9HYME|nr:hypothetical protein QAD02_022956 [Eretmocerus hayati]